MKIFGMMRQMVLSVFIASCCFGKASAASGVEDFYKTHPLTIIVGFSPGGGFDIYARLLAQHLADHLPGRPRVVVENMPGAGSLKAALNIMNVAPRDGSVIGTFGRTVPFAPLLSDAKFDGTRFDWVGSVTSDVSVCIASASSPIKSWSDMLAKTFVAGGIGHDDDFDINSNLLKNVFGAKIRLVTGYPGSNDVKAAMERGEVDGLCGLSYSTLISSYASELRTKAINVLLQVSLNKGQNLPGVPFVGDFATPAQKSVLRLLLEPQSMARPFAIPPDAPRDRVAALQAAFDATMKDPAFLRDAKQAHLPVTPMQGPDLKKLVVALYALPKTVVAQSKRAIEDSSDH